MISVVFVMVSPLFAVASARAPGDIKHISRIEIISFECFWKIRSRTGQQVFGNNNKLRAIIEHELTLAFLMTNCGKPGHVCWAFLRQKSVYLIPCFRDNPLKFCTDIQMHYFLCTFVFWFRRDLLSRAWFRICQLRFWQGLTRRSPWWQPMSPCGRHCGNHFTYIIFIYTYTAPKTFLLSMVRKLYAAIHFIRTRFRCTGNYMLFLIL